MSWESSLRRHSAPLKSPRSGMPSTTTTGRKSSSKRSVHKGTVTAPPPLEAGSGLDAEYSDQLIGFGQQLAELKREFMRYAQHQHQTTSPGANATAHTQREMPSSRPTTHVRFGPSVSHVLPNPPDDNTPTLTSSECLDDLLVFITRKANRLGLIHTYEIPSEVPSGEKAKMARVLLMLTTMFDRVGGILNIDPRTPVKPKQSTRSRVNEIPTTTSTRHAPLVDEEWDEDDEVDTSASHRHSDDPAERIYALLEDLEQREAHLLQAQANARRARQSLDALEQHDQHQQQQQQHSSSSEPGELRERLSSSLREMDSTVHRYVRNHSDGASQHATHSHVQHQYQHQPQQQHATQQKRTPQQAAQQPQQQQPESTAAHSGHADADDDELLRRLRGYEMAALSRSAVPSQQQPQSQSTTGPTAAPQPFTAQSSSSATRGDRGVSGGGAYADVPRYTQYTSTAAAHDDAAYRTRQQRPPSAGGSVDEEYSAHARTSASAARVPSDAYDDRHEMRHMFHDYTRNISPPPRGDRPRDSARSPSPAAATARRKVMERLRVLQATADELSHSHGPSTTSHRPADTQSTGAWRYNAPATATQQQQPPSNPSTIRPTQFSSSAARPRSVTPTSVHRAASPLRTSRVSAKSPSGQPQYTQYTHQSQPQQQRYQQQPQPQQQYQQPQQQTAYYPQQSQYSASSRPVMSEAAVTPGVSRRNSLLQRFRTAVADIDSSLVHAA